MQWRSLCSLSLSLSLSALSLSLLSLSPSPSGEDLGWPQAGAELLVKTDGGEWKEAVCKSVSKDGSGGITVNIKGTEATDLVKVKADDYKKIAERTSMSSCIVA